MPPGLGQHSDTWLHAVLPGHHGVVLERALQHQDVLDAGHPFHLVQIGGLHLAAVNRTALDHRMKHAGQLDIDAKFLLSGDDVVQVNAALRLADDAIVFGVLELEFIRSRRFKRGRQCRQLPITGRAG